MAKTTTTTTETSYSKDDQQYTVEVMDADGVEHSFEGKGMNFFQDGPHVRVYVQGEQHAIAGFTSPKWVKRSRTNG